MALFRALSSTRNRDGGGYNRLQDESLNDSASSPSSANSSHAVLKRVTSVPARMLFGSSSKKRVPETGHDGGNNNYKSKEEQGKKGGKSVVHPVLSLFEGKWGKKKTKKVTANPGFSRYLDYLKEGGVWNMDTDSPVIYYK